MSAEGKKVPNQINPAHYSIHPDDGIDLMVRVLVNIIVCSC